MRLSDVGICLLALVSLPASAAPETAPTANLTLSAKNPPQLDRPLRNVITIEGDITPTIADKFAQSIDANVQTVAIVSAGGDAESARRIGRLIRQHDIGVQIVGFCGGVCAQYVFVAGEPRVLTPNSLVVFGASARGLNVLVSKNPDPAASSIYAAEASADLAYYQELGVPERLLIDPLLLMAPQCQGIAKDPAGQPTVAHADVYSFVFLSKDYFDAIGLPVSGSWPSTVDELKQVVAGKFRQGTSFYAMTKTPSPLPSLAQEKAQLGQVTACSAAQLAPKQ